MIKTNAIDELETEAGFSEWDELIDKLDEEYIRAFKSADWMAIQDAAIELSAYGYEEDHFEHLQDKVFKEISNYTCYLEHPEWFEGDDEIPERPDCHYSLFLTEA